LRRIVRPEILDTTDASPEEVHDSLVDLQRINRWFGGASTTAKLVDEIVRKTGRNQLSMVDVGSATGDIPLTIQGRLALRGIRLDYTLLDRDPIHFAGTTVPRVRGDALALPFRDNSFDVVACSLLAHHLDPDELRGFAKEGLRVSRIALLINDLRRSYLHLAFVYAGKPLFRRITRHDSVASVWRSYTPHEMRNILNHGVARNLTLTNNYLFRMGIVAWK